MRNAKWRAALARLLALDRLNGVPGIMDAINGDRHVCTPLVQELMIRWAEDAEALEAAVLDLSRLQGIVCPQDGRKGSK